VFRLGFRVPPVFRPGFRVPSVFRPCSVRVPSVFRPCSGPASVFRPCSVRVPSVFHPCSVRVPGYVWGLISKAQGPLNWVGRAHRALREPRPGPNLILMCRTRWYTTLLRIIRWLFRFGSECG